MPPPREYVRANQALFHDGLVVYYPGSGIDRDPFHTFETCRNPVFIHADYMTTEDQVHNEVLGQTGWRIAEVGDLNPGHFGMRCWDDFWANHPESVRSANPDTAFGIRASLVSSDGNRATFIFLHTDGIGTYRVLTRLGRVDVVVLQDHGFGLNWDKFGANGALHQSAARHLPRWLYVAADTDPWPGYTRVTDYTCYDDGQMHGHQRALFRNDGDRDDEAPLRANRLAKFSGKRPPVRRFSNPQ